MSLLQQLSDTCDDALIARTSNALTRKMSDIFVNVADDEIQRLEQ